MRFFWEAYDMGEKGGRQKYPPSPKSVTHRTMKKLGTVLPYLKKIQKIHKSRDTPLEFCKHQHFFTGNQQLSLYQELQIYIQF